MRPKFMLIVICIETAIICFFLFGFYIHVNRFKPKFQPVLAPKFSKEVVYNSLSLNDEQKKEYDKILNRYFEEQRELENEKRQNFPKLHSLVGSPNSNIEEIDELEEKQVEIFSKEISNSTDYLLSLKNILDENQKNTFCDILTHKEMHKIMPPLNEQPRGPQEEFKRHGYSKHRHNDHNHDIPNHKNKDMGHE